MCDWQHNEAWWRTFSLVPLLIQALTTADILSIGPLKHSEISKKIYEFAIHKMRQ